ncbi:MAG TPA: sugar transferase [Thermoguttaceae bacterium]|nr:sugar transferase [Thermoguttaceae bacterium]
MKYDLGVDARARVPLVQSPADYVVNSPSATAPTMPARTTALPHGHARIRPVRHDLISLAQQRLTRGEPFVVPEGHRSRIYHVSKRAFDVVGAAALLVLISPVFLTVYFFLMVTTRGKPFFTQKRLGYRGKPFTMLKFRTMTPDAESRRGEVENEKDGPIFKNRRDARVTRLGRLLRSTSLDETPQLFNVLLGRMSLVGPRPPIGEEVAEYEPWQRRRLSVKPGLTCLWQVSGRSEIDFEDWMRMDLWYVRHQSWSTDLKFLVRTPWSVLTGRGAY